MYGNLSGEFVCGYWGPSAWWPIEAGLLKFLASGPGQKNSDPWSLVYYNYCYTDTTSKRSSNNLSLESSDKNIKMADTSVDWSD